jgi:predicted RNA binding protein YcfA (HicA-like mRNA interferase family)
LPKAPRLTAQEAEKLLLDAGFTLTRTSGSHRIYFKDGIRVVAPFHSGKILHPKIVRQVMDAIAPEDDDSDNNGA